MVVTVLKFSISLSSLTREWSVSGGRLIEGGSWLEPFDHPQLETGTTTDGRTWMLTVRERMAGSSLPRRSVLSVESVQATACAGDSWPLNSLTVHISADGLAITARNSVAPIYLVAAGDRLHASWDPAELGSHLSPDRLSAREAARVLSGHGRYGWETVLDGLVMLTVGARARWSARGLSVTYPEAAKRDLPRVLAPGADPVEGFETLLANALASRPLTAEVTAVQLSGGQDSATLALSLGDAWPGQVSACALLLPGAVGVQQRERREHLIRAARLSRDVLVPALEYQPFMPSGTRLLGRCGVYDEPYVEAQTELTGRLAASGIRTVVAGFGGDELMATTRRRTRTAPVLPWLGPVAHAALAERDHGTAPATTVAESTLLALRTVSPYMLRGGLWPVAPLAELPVVRFARWLPEGWRQDKRLMRERLKRRGLPTNVVRAPMREVFSDVMAQALHEHGPALLRRMAADSPLIDAGLITRAGILAAADDCARSARAAALYTPVYAPIALDLHIRSLG
ncbi:hypothetical protein ABZ946_28805 [Streptomyces sp. NPDC046324]|uniref:hypothetical protein n=1 Tax=Streptomyces sp. NPDC046324 TaxID=3154915 RepID=UPI0033D22AAC